jgi:hypothetical protein
MADRMRSAGADIDLSGHLGTDLGAYFLAEYLGDMSLFDEYADALYSSDADLLDFDFLNKDTKIANLLNNVINNQIAEKQEIINIAQEKAKAGKALTAEEQKALQGVYGLISLGGSLMGYPEASKLLDIYLNPKEAAKYGERTPYKLNPNVYQESVIVQYAMEEMKRIIAEDYSDGTIDNPSITSNVLSPTPKRNSNTEGRILDDRKLIAEQDNLRLKNTDHRFPLQADIQVKKNGNITITWSVLSNYNFAPYPDTKYTLLPFSKDRGQVLKLDDGLSQYLTKIGMATEFHHKAQWKESIKK